MDGIDEQDRNTASRGPVLPLGELLDDLVGDPRDRVPADLGPIKLVEVRRDLAGHEATGGQRAHDLVDLVQAPLALLDDHRVEAGVAVTRHLDLDRPDLGEHGLGRVPLREFPASRPSASCVL